MKHPVGSLKRTNRSSKCVNWLQLHLSGSPNWSLSKDTYRPYKFVLLEALSATGLRSIRYAKEIPLVKSVYPAFDSSPSKLMMFRFVIANDLSNAATATMRRNVELNGLGPTDESSADPSAPAKVDLGKVRVNESDAW